MISIVLPVATHSPSFCIFKELTLPSLIQYASSLPIYLICPEKDQKVITPMIQSYSFFHLIPEDPLLSPFLQTSGWFKQQLLKLEISRFLSTPYYVVMDSDMYLTQWITEKDFFVKDKIKYTSEKYQTENNMYYSQNSRWWKNSCDFLQIPLSTIIHRPEVMGATPQVLITEIVQSLLGWMKQVKGSSYQTLFCEGKCTEFTLYWLYILSLQKQDLYIDPYIHSSLIPLWILDVSRNVLDESVATPEVVRRSLLEPNSFFSVIQGYLPIQREPLLQEASLLLHRPNVEAVFLVSSMLRPQIYQGAFTFEERFQQTLQTIDSIKQRVPNSICILIEGSELTSKEKELFTLETRSNSRFDVLLECHTNPEVEKAVHNTKNIGYGECKLLEMGMKYVMESVLPFIQPFLLVKLGARYQLTNEFSLSSFSKTEYTFQKHYNDWCQSDVYTTGLYSVPYRYFWQYHQVLKDLQTKEMKCVEWSYYQSIPQDQVKTLERIGLEGYLSFNKTYFKI